MAWLPQEDETAGKSEELVLKYHPLWTGCGETRHKIQIPKVYMDYFDIESEEVFDLEVPFTRETWNGRMKACRGIGAALPEEEVAAVEEEHMRLLRPVSYTHLDVYKRQISAEKAKLHSETEFEKYRIVQYRMFMSDDNKFY